MPPVDRSRPAAATARGTALHLGMGRRLEAAAAAAATTAVTAPLLPSGLRATQSLHCCEACVRVGVGVGVGVGVRVRAVGLVRVRVRVSG